MPGVAQSRELVTDLHAALLHFDLVSWDIAIAECGQPTLIEFNVLAQELHFHQMNNGPLFGVLTESVLARIK